VAARSLRIHGWPCTMAMRRHAIRLNKADSPTCGRPTIAMFIATNVAPAPYLCGKRAACPFFGPMTTPGRVMTNDPPPLSCSEGGEGMRNLFSVLYSFILCSLLFALSSVLCLLSSHYPTTPSLHYSAPRQRVAWA